MTENEAKDFLQGKLDCMNKCDVFECKNTDECDNCDYCYSQGTFGQQRDALIKAIKTLEEIQQYRAIGTVKGYERAIESSIENYNLYREYKAKVQDFEAIGTVEEITNLIKFLSFDDDTSILEDLRMLVEYYAIGTVEEFKTLKEKNEPEKPLFVPTDDTCLYQEYRCPSCNEWLADKFKPYRCKCGQKLDW